MPNEVWVAIIGGICVAVPTVISTVVSNNKSNVLMQYRIEQLDIKVEKHNKVIERMAVVENSLKSAHRRIDDIER